MGKELHIFNQRKHAKKRFEERFEIIFNKKLRKKIIYMINNKELTLLSSSKKSNNYYFELGDIKMIIVYYRKTKNIATCLYYDEYLEDMYNKLTMGIVKRIRKKTEKIIGKEFTCKENKELEKFMKKQVVKIRTLSKKEAEIKFKGNDYINNNQEDLINK